jgi:hypothetical protein
MEFIYNNILFFVQTCFSLFGLIFTMTMLLKGGDASIYLPIFSSIITLWIPSPTQTLRSPIPQPIESFSPRSRVISRPITPLPESVIPISRPSEQRSIIPVPLQVIPMPSQRPIIPVSESIDEFNNNEENSQVSISIS